MLKRLAKVSTKLYFTLSCLYVYLNNDWTYFLPGSVMNMHYTQCEDTVAVWGSSPEGFLCSLRKRSKMSQNHFWWFQLPFCVTFNCFPTKTTIFYSTEQKTPPSTTIVALTSFSTFFDGDSRENDYIAFDEYYNEPIGRSFGNCEIPFVTS